jgi:hypothetical protein
MPETAHVNQHSQHQPEERSAAVGCCKVDEQVGEEVAGLGVQAPPVRAGRYVHAVSTWVTRANVLLFQWHVTFVSVGSRIHNAQRGSDWRVYLHKVCDNRPGDRVNECDRHLHSNQLINNDQTRCGWRHNRKLRALLTSWFTKQYTPADTRTLPVPMLTQMHAPILGRTGCPGTCTIHCISEQAAEQSRLATAAS